MGSDIGNVCPNTAIAADGQVPIYNNGTKMAKARSSGALNFGSIDSDDDDDDIDDDDDGDDDDDDDDGNSNNHEAGENAEGGNGQGGVDENDDSDEKNEEAEEPAPRRSSRNSRFADEQFDNAAFYATLDYDVLEKHGLTSESLEKELLSLLTIEEELHNEDPGPVWDIFEDELLAFTTSRKSDPKIEAEALKDPE